MARRPLCSGLSPALGAVSASLQEKFGPCLETYAQRVRYQSKPNGPKIINDPVWRTIRVEAWEVVVLDSPILQRLRNIRQLGLAGFVFPGANYTRFEHSVGVLHQTQRLIESVNRNAKAHALKAGIPFVPVVSPNEEVTLRLSALLHDCGHTFFSHVSERTISRMEFAVPGVKVSSMREEAQEYFKATSAPQPAEIFSCLLVLLPEFVEILGLSQVPEWTEDPYTLAARIANYIAGGRDGRKPCLSEMISGGLDADKLDYLPRDCYMAGLPMPVDVDRLLEKVHAVTVPAGNLGIDYNVAYSLHADTPVQTLAVQLSGARAFEELVVSRSLLYEKLYNHQKVRSIEGMVENALDLLAQSCEYFKSATAFLEPTDAEILNCHFPTGTVIDQAKYTVARELIEAVSLRDTFSRAFAFGPSLVPIVRPSDEAEEEKVRTGWETLKPLVTKGRTEAALSFRREVAELSKRLLIASGQAGLASEISEYHLVIDLPDVQGISERTRFNVGDEEQGVMPYSQRFRVERWAAAYENQKSVGYIYCPVQFRIAVYLAARHLVQQKSRLSFGPDSWSMAKVPPREIAKMAILLRERGEDIELFNMPSEVTAVTHLLSSEPERTRLLGVYSADINELEQRFHTYQSHNGDTVTNASIREWLLQFDRQEIPLAVQLLKHIRYWDRAAITDAFALALEDEDVARGQWVPLGGPTTSGRHLTYLWPDIQTRSGSGKNARVLSEASELSQNGVIVFYDDNVGSGGQGRTVLQQWLSISRDMWVVDEEHVSPLPANIVSLLRHSPIRFVFATGRREGLDNLVQHARELLANDDVRGYIVAPSDLSGFRLSSRVFADGVAATRAKAAFEAAGRKALADKLRVWNAEKVSNRLLGYGNVGGLTVFYYNVPTTTVTALWKESSLVDSKWTPLFPRRPRN